ncbi:reverse transcriptase domain-containing protein [Tanacetum coccineum]
MLFPPTFLTISWLLRTMVPASPGNTYFSSSNNSFGLVPIASPTLSLFHDDPYIKVMHAYYAKKSPIPPKTIVPPSSMLSPMFNPQEFFLPEELLPLKKRGCDRSSSSTSDLPQAFEIGESSRKTSLERHEEQIEEILNHLDELSLTRIEHIEEKIKGIGNGQNKSSKISRMPPKRTSTSEAPAMTQAAIRKLVADSVTAALEAQAATMANADNTNRNTREREAPVARKCSYKEFMSCQPINFKGTEGAVGLIRWFERTESMFSHSKCTEDCKVKFATSTLTKEALSWWNSFAQPIGIEEAYKITWVEFKKLLIKKYTGNHPLCKKCTLHHIGPCIVKCNTRNKMFHLTKNCRNKRPTTGSNLLPVIVTCHACGEKGHYTNQCRKTTNNNAQGRAYMLRDKNAHQDPNIVTAQVMEKKSDEKRLEDILVVREFPEVFPKDLPGLPPVRHVEFQIDLIPGAASVARAPYRLTPLEMHKLSNQL